MPQTASAIAPGSVLSLVMGVLHLNLVPALGEVTIDRNEHDGDNHFTVVTGTARLHFRLDLRDKRIHVGFHAVRSGEYGGRHQNVYYRDLITRDEYETLTTSATVASDANPRRLATAIKKVLPSAQRAFAVLDEWEARQRSHAAQRATTMALVNATLGTTLAPSHFRENTSAYFPDGSPLQRLFGQYCRIVVDNGGQVSLEGARINFAGKDLQRVLDALNSAATTFVDGLNTTTDRG